MITNDKGRIFGVYCGVSTGKVIIVSGNYTVIRFKTDIFGQDKGFLINFTFVSLGKNLNLSLFSRLVLSHQFHDYKIDV